MSVVATGIDKTAAEAFDRQPEMRTAPVQRPAPAPVAAAPAYAPAQPAPAPVAAYAAPQAPAPVKPAPYQLQAGSQDLEDDFTAALEAEIAHVTPQDFPNVSPRMPRVEDFPPVVQAELERRAAASPEAHGDERGPMGLLRRLTTGLSRREDEEMPLSRAPEARPAEASPYAPRRQAAESAARPAAPVRAQSEDDQLEIPAFLRRQSS